MATKTIGAAGDYTTIAAWAAYVKAIGSLTENEIGELIDNANYTRGAKTDLDFSAVTLNGFTITLKATTNKHNGDYGTGARIVASVDYDGVYQARNLIILDIEIQNTSTQNGAIALTNTYLATAKRCLLKTASTNANSRAVRGSSGGSLTLEACRLTGGFQSIYIDHADTNLLNNTIEGAITGPFLARDITGNVQNNAVHSCTTDWDANGFSFGGTTTNNASEDGTHPGTSGVTMVAANDLEVDGYTAKSGGALDGAGIDLGITYDAANLGYSAVPAIGAYEADAAGVIEITGITYAPETDWDYVAYDESLIPEDSVLMYDTGTHDGANNSATLEDSTKTWTVNEWDGYTIKNITDVSEGIAATNDADSILTFSTAMTGGTDNDFDTGDSYQIIYPVSTGDEMVYDTVSNLGGTVSLNAKGVPTITGASGTHQFGLKIRNASTKKVSATVTMEVTVV